MNNEINIALKDIEISIGELAHDYGKLSADATKKRIDYDLAWAKQMLEIRANDTEGLIAKEKEAKALLAVSEQFTQCRIAEALLDACKRRLSALESQLSAIQTRSKLLQMERSLDRYTP